MMINMDNPQPKTQEHNTPILDDQSPETAPAYSKNTIKIGLGLAIFGFLVFLLGARPSIFNLDRSPVVGFVQISVFLFGLGIICLGGYITLNAFWPEGKKSIAADIGSRVISTGYVICIFTGMADIFGLGSHRLPNVFFGPLQARGMSMGMATIAIGFLLLIRYNRKEKKPKTLEDNNTTENETGIMNSNSKYRLENSITD